MDPGSHVPDPMMAGDFAPLLLPCPLLVFPSICVCSLTIVQTIHLTCFFFFLFLKPGSLLEFVPALVIIVVVVPPT